jgi:hypothetical protein
MGELEQLEDAFPAPDAGAVASAKARVRVRYRETAPKRTTIRRGRVLAAGLTVLLAAACAGTFLLVSAGDNSGSTALARELASLARAAAKAPGMVPAGRNVWMYRRISADYGALATESANGHSVSYGYHEPEQIESWISTTGIEIDCAINGQTRFYAPVDRQNWIAAGRHTFAPPAGTIGYDRIAGDPPRFAGVVPSRLPATVDGIKKLIQNLPHRSPNVVVDAVHQLFLSAEVTPATRAAILRYLEQVPGLALIPHTRTHGGRVGIGIGVAGNGLTGSTRWVRRILIFDSQTAALIGYREVIVGKVPYGGARPGQGDGAWEDDISLGAVRLPKVKAPPRNRPINIGGPTARRACSTLPRP